MGKDMRYVALLDCYGLLLTNKQLNAMELYYYNDFSLSEIAEHTRTTRQGVHDNIRRAETYLDELEFKLRFVETSNRLNRLFTDIDNQSKLLIDGGKNRNEINSIAESISRLVENGKNFLIDL